MRKEISSTAPKLSSPGMSWCPLWHCSSAGPAARMVLPPHPWVEKELVAFSFIGNIPHFPASLFQRLFRAEVGLGSPAAAPATVAGALASPVLLTLAQQGAAGVPVLLESQWDSGDVPPVPARAVGSLPLRAVGLAVTGHHWSQQSLQGPFSTS